MHVLHETLVACKDRLKVKIKRMTQSYSNPKKVRVSILILGKHRKEKDQ